MRKKTHIRWNRSPRTTQERRTNHKRCKWARGRRKLHSLPDAYSDLPVCHQKTWKTKRLTQYHKDGRGKQHTIYLPIVHEHWHIYSKSWRLEDYLNKHYIPNRIKIISHLESRWRDTHMAYRLVGWKSKEILRKVRPCSHKNKVKTQYKREHLLVPVNKWVSVPLDKPREYFYRVVDGYEITWWCDNDIGIDFILNRFDL